MNTENTELLERAVINLTVQNAKLQQELKKKTEDSDMWYRWYNDKNKFLEKTEEIVHDLKSKIEDLEHYKFSTEGLWAIDKAPSEIQSLQFFKEHAYQLGDFSQKEVVLESVNVDEETE